MDNRIPTFHTIDMLDTYTLMIDECFENTEDQLETLIQAKDQPHILNRDTIERIIKLYENQLADNWVLEEQLKRWSALDLSSSQEKELRRLEARVIGIELQSQKVLELVNTHFRGNSIEDILEMDDAELGLQFLMGMKKP